MAGAREIRSKIKSIQNTQKITKAMEMVAASKMRKAQDRMRAGRPYALKIWRVITHLAHAHSEYYHPFLIPREQVRRVGFIIVTTDRGLCGGLNTNLFRVAVQAMKEWDQQGIGIDVCTIGAKAGMFFSRIGANVIAHVSHLGDQPRLQDLVGGARVIVEAYRDGKIDRLFLFFNEFVNSLTQRPTRVQLLPLDPAKEDWLKHRWDYIYEPEAKEVLDHLLRRYLESVVYQTVVENIACEQAARMVAMKAASDNAGDLIEELKLIYNKARQASITRELAEIVGGAAAV